MTLNGTSFVGDLHICGSCQKQSFDITMFMKHKRTCVLSKILTEPEITFPNRPNLEISSIEAFPNYPNTDNLLDNNSNHVTDSINVSTQPNEFLDVTLPFTDDCNVFLSPTFTDKSPLITQPDINVIPVSSPSVETSINTIKYKILTEMKPKRYKCEYTDCNYISIYMKDLERHFRVHTKEKPFNCQTCKKSFSRLDKLKSHMKCHTGEKLHACDKCDYRTVDSTSLKKHARIHTNERPYKCQLCQYAGRTSSQLVIHLRTHTDDRPYQCHICTMKFKIKCDLKRHIRSHTGEKPFHCSECSYKCSVKGNLISHQRLMHGKNGKEMACTNCNFTSFSRKLFREHSRSHLERKFPCPECSYSSSTLSGLKAHQLIHSADKPFKCPHCKYSCRQSCNISTHIKKVHPTKRMKAPIQKETKTNGSLPRPFSCNQCEAFFVRKDSLRSHLKDHQRIENEKPLEPTYENQTDILIEDPINTPNVSPVKNKRLVAINKSRVTQLSEEYILNRDSSLEKELEYQTKYLPVLNFNQSLE